MEGGHLKVWMEFLPTEDEEMDPRVITNLEEKVKIYLSEECGREFECDRFYYIDFFRGRLREKIHEARKMVSSFCSLKWETEILL